MCVRMCKPSLPISHAQYIQTQPAVAPIKSFSNALYITKLHPTNFKTASNAIGQALDLLLPRPENTG